MSNIDENLSQWPEDIQKKCAEIARWQNWSIDQAWRWVKLVSHHQGLNYGECVEQALDLVKNNAIARPHKKLL